MDVLDVLEDMIENIKEYEKLHTKGECTQTKKTKKKSLPHLKLGYKH